MSTNVSKYFVRREREREIKICEKKDIFERVSLNYDYIVYIYKNITLFSYIKKTSRYEHSRVIFFYARNKNALVHTHKFITRGMISTSFNKNIYFLRI